MNKEQIEEAKKYFDDNFEFFNYKKELTKESCISLMVEYLESKRSEIERKAYGAGQRSILNSEGYYFVNNKKIPAPVMTYDQWKESQNKYQ